VEDNMPEYTEIPLHLCQVLAEEFENLPARDGAPVTSPPSNIVDGAAVNDDWTFDEGHIGDRERLAEILRRAHKDWLIEHNNQEPDAKTLKECDLYTFLAFTRTELWERGTQPTNLVAILNDILSEPATGDGLKVFEPVRFAKLKPTMRDETRRLFELWEDDPARWQPTDEWGSFKRSDLARFRRVLLEDAFPLENAFPPPTIKRIYDLRLRLALQRAHEAGRSALCFSGGGIRSGTFALGTIQSLAKHHLLDKFDYLSTVSGGGYIGGWLTAWIHRHPRGLEGVIGELNGEARTTKLEPEPKPLRHLRDYSSFITPRTGLLSADPWTFVVIYIRNLLLNWVVLIPLLASVLMIPRVATAVVLTHPDWMMLTELLLLSGFGVLLLKWDWKTAWTLAAVGIPSLLVIYAGYRGWLTEQGVPSEATVEGVLLFAGTLLVAYTLAYMRVNRPSNSGAVRQGTFFDRHRDQSSFIWLCMFPLTIAATLLTTFWAWYRRTLGLSTQKQVDCVGLYGWDAVRKTGKCLELFGWKLDEFMGFLLYGAALGILSWLIYVLLTGSSWLGARDDVVQKVKHAPLDVFTGIFKNAGREFIVTFLASLLGSILLYVAAVKIPVFYDPVVDPFGIQTFKDGNVDGLLTYTHWYGAEMYTWLAMPVYLLVFFLGVTLFVGFTSRRLERAPSKGGGGILPDWLRHPVAAAYVEDEDREWVARASAWVFIVMGGWLFFGGLVLFGPLLFFALGKWLVGIGGASGLLSLLGGRSSLTPGNKKEEGQQAWWQTLGINLLVVAAFIFFACIIIAVSLLAGTIVVWLASTFFSPDFGAWVGISPRDLKMFLDKYPFQSEQNAFIGTHFPSWLYLLLLALLLQLLGRFFAHFINLNKFSLHAGYRDRIIRAFLGASRLKGTRRENPFTGFDPRDDLNMEELRPGLLREGDFEEPDGLTKFVTEINRPGAGIAPSSPPDPVATRRVAAARYLRSEIVNIDGESRRYLKDPPESIEGNPSFRSALFADLGRILQDKFFGDAPGFSEVLVAARAEYKAMKPPRGNERIMLNRFMLKQIFPYIESPPKQPYRLMHVVNMALNLVGGDKLAWQQRRAESFTATPLHSGSLFVGYRRTRDYGGRNGIRLGTAVAVSGAAASSNMGYFSPSVFVTFVLTFFNARLGWWLGNPGVSGWDTYYRSHPKSTLSPILDEAFGLTDDENPYVLLSDGGHFENLGLYEMVLRRCRTIVVIDGSADPSGSYDDLGGAVRKIRIDLGISIDFTGKHFPILSRPASEKQSGAYFAVGTINYNEADGTQGVEQGTLIYIKPAIYNTEPRDVFNYAKGDPTFPHESTADQFFNEPQFESHRMLGYYILEKLIGDAPPSSPPGPVSIEQLAALLKTKAEEAEDEKDDEEKTLMVKVEEEVEVKVKAK
jgi:hypothetical protein